MSFRTIFVLFFFASSLWASEAAPTASGGTESRVYKKTVKAEFTATYKKVFSSLENNGYFVVFEPNIGKNLSHFAQRWGKNYNKNELEGGQRALAQRVVDHALAQAAHTGETVKL